jgi:hypothetical protein
LDTLRLGYGRRSLIYEAEEAVCCKKESFNDSSIQDKKYISHKNKN